LATFSRTWSVEYTSASRRGAAPVPTETTSRFLSPVFQFSL
jgi:hypothetical protein